MAAPPGPAGGGFVLWAALTGEALDPAVRPLVAALNRTGWVRTVFSCGGHPEEPDSVARGRRQAHVDVLVADLARWRRFVRRCRRDAPAAVRRVGDAQSPRAKDQGRRGVRGGAGPWAWGCGLGSAGVRLRCAEGSLGPLPPWLRDALARSAGQPERRHCAAEPGRNEGSAHRARAGHVSWWRRVFGRERGTSPAGEWRYRRLVLEPVPYDLPPDDCRRVLDTALAAAVAALAPATEPP